MNVPYMIINDCFAASVNRNGSRGTNKRMVATGEEGIARLDLIVADKYYYSGMTLSRYSFYAPLPPSKFGPSFGHKYDNII